MVNHVRRRLWIAAGLLAIYWLGIFAATHLPSDSVESIRLWDKAAHFGAYFGLAVLLALLLHGGGRLRIVRYLAALGICAGYGALDEFLQSFVPGRSPDVQDWLADVAGAACGLFFHRVAMFFVTRPPPLPSSARDAD